MYFDIEMNIWHEIPCLTPYIIASHTPAVKQHKAVAIHYIRDYIVELMTALYAYVCYKLSQKKNHGMVQYIVHSMEEMKS